jgi:hypothetical protein
MGTRIVVDIGCERGAETCATCVSPERFCCCESLIYDNDDDKREGHCEIFQKTLVRNSSEAFIRCDACKFAEVDEQIRAGEKVATP